MQKCFPKIPNIFSAGPEPAKEYILPHGRIYTDVFWIGVGYIGGE